MNGQVERYSRVSVTRADGVVTHADITHVQVRFAVSPAPDAECAETPGAANGAGSGGAGVAAAGEAPAASPVSPGDCFDPDSCCDEREKALIAALRAYLRPAAAPECLLRRLRETLDHCCCEDR